MIIDETTGTIKFEVPNIGVYTLYMPSQYMRTHATAEESAVLDYFKERVKDIVDGNLRGLILPSERDIDGSRLFELVCPTINLSFPNITDIDVVGDIMKATSIKEETQND
jgi:hypothetical protein